MNTRRHPGTETYAARRAAFALVLSALVLSQTACAVATVVGAAAGAAISVTGAVVSTGVSAAGKVVEKTVDLVTPSRD